jgi:hypothetical protein
VKKFTGNGDGFPPSDGRATYMPAAQLPAAVVLGLAR